MSYLSMVESRLPPGFRFHPRDDELICDYLALYKLQSDGSNAAGSGSFPVLIDIDLNKCEPCDLPDVACVGNKEWYFFNLRDRKYATGQRTNRATMSGYWKATGKDRQIVRKGVLVGMRKTLVFYQGRAPKGKKTDWVMHEFRSEGRVDPQPRLASCKEDWVLCRVSYKSRGISTKPTNIKESSYDDTCSSSLPSLTDQTYSVSFNQNNYFQPPPLPILNNITSTSIEQVPCFSSYSQVDNNPLLEFNNNFSTKDHLTSSCFKSLLDQLSKSKKDESYLTDATTGLISSSMWYPQFQS